MHGKLRAVSAKQLAIASGAVVAAAITTWAVRRVADETMYVFFVGAVAVSSWMGGLGLGLAAVVTSIVVVDFAFIEPVGNLQPFSVAQVVQLLSFALVATMVAVLVSALVRARRQAEQLARAADQAKAEAEAASASMSDFLATLSHEVRTPVNALLGYADLLEDGIGGSINDTQREFVRRLRDAARHLLTVVNGVLQIAKMDAGRLAVDMAQAPAAQVIDAAVSVVLPQASSKRIAVVVAPPREIVRFRGDSDRVREIVVNLLSNAVKFAPEGSQVEITMGRGSDGHAPPPIGDSPSLVWICVADHGPGIAPSDRRRIFEPFVQGRNGRAPGKQGTGLGLAISRRLSRLMGGDLIVESQMGEGASFTLWLRAA